MSARMLGAAIATVLLEGCLWQSSLGDVPTPDSGVPPTLADLHNFAKQLVGTYRGTAGADDAEFTQEFRYDGTYTARCLDTASPSSALLCPFYGVNGEGRYQLIGLEVSGAVNAVTWDTQLGAEVESRLNYMRFSDDGETLTYLRVATLQGTIADQIRAAGIPLTESAGTSLLRNYVVLTRQH